MENGDVSLMQQYMPLLSMLAGGILAIAGGFVSTWWFEERREQKLRKALALAFEGEIRAILEIAKKRNYVQEFHNVLNRIEESGKVEIHTFNARREYFSVYRQNVGSIGLLQPPLSRLVARFYTQATAILEDMDLWATLNETEVSPKQAITAYRQLLSLLEDTIKTGEYVVAQVESEYR